MDYTVHGILQARILEWLAFFLLQGSSQPRHRTQVSHIAGRFFTSWAIREAQEYRSGYPIPSPADLPNPGVELGSAALQLDSLPTEKLGKPHINIYVLYIYIYIYIGLPGGVAAAKSLQSCPTLCDPWDNSPPGLPVPGILQARTLEWVAISFSNAWKWKGKVKSLSHVWL